MDKNFKSLKVYMYYDIPQLILLADETDAEYLGILSRSDNYGVSYLSVPITEECKEELESGIIDVLTVYNDSPDSCFILSLTDGDGFSISNEKIEFNDFPKSGLFV